MPTGGPSDPARRSLGNTLRRFRTEAGVTGIELGARSGMSQSKVSKLETGSQLPTVADVEAICRALGLRADALAGLVAETQRLRLNYQTWALAQPHGLALGQRTYGLLEREAWRLTEVAVTVLPGLLQTPAYARDVLRLVLREGENLDHAVTERIHRQELLEDSRRNFRFILLESALQFRYSSPIVTQHQLDHLGLLGNWPNIEIVVRRLTDPLPAVPLHGFTIFDRARVMIETVSGSLTVSDTSDVNEYIELAERLSASAHRIDAPPRVRLAT